MAFISCLSDKTNIIADFTSVSGLFINESQHYGIPPTNTCTTDPIAVNVAGSYYLEFSTFSNYLHWLVLDNIIIPGGVLVANETNAEKISIFPNPAKEKIFISTIRNIIEIKIYNSEGQLIKDRKTNSTVVDVSNLEKGVYYLEISAANKIYNRNSLRNKLFLIRLIPKKMLVSCEF